MAKVNKRLGRGLDSLINSTSMTGRSPILVQTGDAGPSHTPGIAAPHRGHSRDRRLENETARAVDSQPHTGAKQTDDGGMFRMVSIDALRANSRQPRRSFRQEGIAGLAASITRRGVAQPLVVRPVRTSGVQAQNQTAYEIIAGERRWRAARAAGLGKVPVVVRDLDDEASLELALIENVQREDLNALDRAGAYDSYCREFGIKAEDLAQRLGEDRSTVVNYMRLLELPEAVKDMVTTGALSMGHARCILSVNGEQARTELAQTAVARGLSVRATEELARLRKGQTPASQPESTKPSPRFNSTRSAHIADLQARLQLSVGTKVTIRESRRKGRGRIVIDYYSLDDFDRIAAMLGLADE